MEKLILQVLYDGLNNALEGAVTHIEPIKTFKRPSSSVVFCRIQLTNSRKVFVWAKTLTPSSKIGLKEKRIIRDYDLTQYLYNTLDKSGYFLVPRPLFHSPEHRLIVTEHMQGDRLQDKIERGVNYVSFRTQRKSLEKDCYQAGQWLHTFQKVTKNYCPGMTQDLSLLQVQNVERIIDQTIVRLDNLTDKNPNTFNQKSIFLIKDFLRNNLEEYQKEKIINHDYICSIHGDFFPGNLLSNRSTVIGIDFSSCTWGSRYFDLSYFIFQIETIGTKARHNESLTHSLIECFLYGYNNICLDKSFWNLNPAIKINFVSHCISRLLSLSDSKWNTLNPKLFYRKFNFYMTRKKLIRHINSS